MHDHTPDEPKKRPPFRTVGFPKRPDARRLGWAWSLVAHLLVLLLLLAPTLFRSVVPADAAEGAGGPGPAGGGGGGTQGTGGRDMFDNPEKLRYIKVAPEPAKATAPEVEPLPPEVPTPVPPPAPVPEPEQKVVQIAQLLPEDGPRPMMASGTGGGTGSDGSSGTGPGTGGGIGSGVGTGIGSGIGPGTGGGDAEIYPPTPVQVFLPPLPAPDRIGKPYHLIAYFEVDETGRSRLLRFNESRDRGYNRELRQRLEQMRFRPAVRADGTPVKQVYPLAIWIY